MKENNYGELLEKGLCLYEEKKIEEAAELFRLIADQSVTAQFCLGEIYWNKEINAENCDELALLWYERAGENGNALAQLWLGNNYCIGIRSDANPQKAVYWYEKAAQQNMVLAQYHLAVCYATGWGTDKNEHRAIELMRLAADGGFFDADIFLAEYYRDNTVNYELYEERRDLLESKYAESIFYNEDQAKKYIELLLADKSGAHTQKKAFSLLCEKEIFKNERGRLLMAECYLKGLGTSKNREYAIRILQEIASKSPKARTLLFLLEEKNDNI